MKYIEYINELLRKEVARHDQLVLFGQNVSAGSCIGGFTRGLCVRPTGRIINTTNAENSLCGFGFGVMLRGAAAVFFMKQLDFLLLGIDQLVNTCNIIRNFPAPPIGSFTIMPIIVDNGWQGPQSSLNTFRDFCSIARIRGYTITNQMDAEAIISTQMVAPGFRIIGISQRLFKEDVIVPESVEYRSDDSTLFQYSKGKDATVVCFNFTFPHGWKLHQALKTQGKQVSLFNVNSVTPVDWSRIVENARVTRKLVVLDDSKSANLSCFALLSEVQKAVRLQKMVVFTRKVEDNWLNPISDQFEIPCADVIAQLS